MNWATRRIPRRFFLTSRCLVWDLAEVEAWIEERRRASDAASIQRGTHARHGQAENAAGPSPVTGMALACERVNGMVQFLGGSFRGFAFDGRPTMEFFLHHGGVL